MHIVRYRKYPNNEIRATHYYKAFKKAVNSKGVGGDNESSPLSCASAPDEEEKEALPLNLTLATISDSGDSILPFRKTKFGRNAKNTILRIGGAYDTLSDDPSDFVFLTGTLPGNTPSAFRAIAEYSSHIAESIGHWIQRTVKSKHYFYVWELQKRGALHFHYCIYTPNSESRSKILSTFKPKWTSLLDDISARSGTCLWEGDSGACWTDRYGTLQAYAQEVHTSVAAYLSGYIGNTKDKHSQDESSPYYPRRWWGASRKSTSLLKELTEEVSVEYTGYREANHKMLLHYEQVLHDSPKAHHYPHKVGIGSTVISYHPEDKGTQIWQALQKMTLQHKTHPHIASLILACRHAAVMGLYPISELSRSKNSSYGPLLQSLQDSLWWTALQRWTLQDRHLQTLLTLKSRLPVPTSANHHLGELLRTLTLIEEFLTLNQGHLRFNQYGWLCNSEDLPYTVDFTREVWQSSTTDSDGADALEGTAHGSLSPQNPLLQQLRLID